MSKNEVTIEQPKRNRICLEVQGTAHLIQNNFPQKVIEEMLKKHMGITTIRAKKIPREVVEGATIRNVDGKICIPPQAFKSAMLTASTSIKLMPKTRLRTALFVVGQSCPITYDSMLPRMDMVRVGMSKTPDVRFRPSFVGWKCKLLLEFASALNVQAVCDLLNRAGQVGVGEWRPEKNGPFGTFAVVRNVEDSQEVADVERDCAVPMIGLTIPAWALDAEISPEVLDIIASSHSSDIQDEGEGGESGESGDNEDAAEE